MEYFIAMHGVNKRIKAFFSAKPECDNMLQPEPRNCESIAFSELTEQKYRHADGWTDDGRRERQSEKLGSFREPSLESTCM